MVVTSSEPARAAGPRPVAEDRLTGLAGVSAEPAAPDAGPVAAGGTAPAAASDAATPATAPSPAESAASAPDDASPSRPIDLDYLYNEIDKLYHAVAHGCGLSDCAYWMVYDLEIAGGTLAQRVLCDQWAYSKQTISSALKTLIAKGLVTQEFCAGSSKSKVVSLTPEGRAFSAARIIPAIRAEERAFGVLSREERALLVNLVRRYVRALDEEVAAITAGDEAARAPRAPARQAGGEPPSPT